MYYSDSRRSIELDPRRTLVWLSLVGGLMLNLLPYPDHWFIYKPDFVAVILVIWAMRLRRPLTFTLVFMFGILMDVAYTATLGQHAFAYCVLLATASLFRRPYAIANHLHRCVFILITLTVTLAASLLVSMVYEAATLEYSVFYPALVGAGICLLLPMVLAMLRLPLGGHAH